MTQLPVDSEEFGWKGISVETIGYHWIRDRYWMALFFLSFCECECLLVLVNLLS